MILSPGEGEVLQGVVAINGITQVDGFRSAEIAFGYGDDPTNSWFALAQSTKPVKEGLLASWDTTTITDGIYRLRLQVFLQDGKVQQAVVTGLRVRNYLPVETSTPQAGARLGTPTPTPTPLEDFQVAAQATRVLPTNPAQVTPGSLLDSARLGVLIVMVTLFVSILYLALRAVSRR